jgi:hypothetical protein
MAKYEKVGPRTALPPLVERGKCVDPAVGSRALNGLDNAKGRHEASTLTLEPPSAQEWPHGWLRFGSGHYGKEIVP